MAKLTNLIKLEKKNSEFVGKFKDIFLNKKKGIISRRVWDRKGNQMIDIKGPAEEVEKKYDEWKEEICTIIKPKYQCPDGFVGTMERIWNEVENGNLHGCIVSA